MDTPDWSQLLWLPLRLAAVGGLVWAVVTLSSDDPKVRKLVPLIIIALLVFGLVTVDKVA